MIQLVRSSAAPGCGQRPTPLQIKPARRAPSPLPPFHPEVGAGRSGDANINCSCEETLPPLVDSSAHHVWRTAAGKRAILHMEPFTVSLRGTKWVQGFGGALGVACGNNPFLPRPFLQVLDPQQALLVALTESKPKTQPRNENQNIRLCARVVRQPRDGSCLFHSLAHSVGSDAETLRAQIADQISNCPDAKIGGVALRDWVRVISTLSISAHMPFHKFLREHRFFLLENRCNGNRG